MLGSKIVPRSEIFKIIGSLKLKILYWKIISFLIQQKEIKLYSDFCKVILLFEHQITIVLIYFYSKYASSMDFRLVLVSE